VRPPAGHDSIRDWRCRWLSSRAASGLGAVPPPRGPGERFRHRLDHQIPVHGLVSLFASPDSPPRRTLFFGGYSPGPVSSHLGHDDGALAIRSRSQVSRPATPFGAGILAPRPGRDDDLSVGFGSHVDRFQFWPMPHCRGVALDENALHPRQQFRAGSWNRQRQHLLRLANRRVDSLVRNANRRCHDEECHACPDGPCSQPDRAAHLPPYSMPERSLAFSRSRT